MTVRYYPDMEQGSEAWHAIRCGMLTASEIKLIITPKTLKAADNDKEKQHLYELLAQRVTRYVEPHYVSDDMLRGREDEIDAKLLYDEKYAPVTDCGFVTNDEWGFEIGYSPDAMVRDDGQVEFKSRLQKHHAATIIEGAMPSDFMLQVQTGLLVTQRKWCDFGSYCGGMPMFVTRIYPDDTVQDAIVMAATAFEQRLEVALAKYERAVIGLFPTERRTYEDIIAS